MVPCCVLIYKARMQTSKKLVLVGSRWNLSDIVFTARDLGYEILGILDHHYWGNTDYIDGIPVIGDERDLMNPDCVWRQYDFFLADWWDGSQDIAGTGNTGEELRQTRIQLLESSQVNVVNLIHPSAQFFHGRDSVSIGHGVLILGGTIFISRITIGNYSAIDWRSNIGTDTVIGNNVIVGAASTLAHVTIKDNCRIGVGCILMARKKKQLEIGANSIVYIGSTVTTNVPDNSVYTMHDRVCRRITKRA